MSNTAEHRTVEEKHIPSTEELRQELQNDLGQNRPIPEDWSGEKIQTILELRKKVQNTFKTAETTDPAEAACDSKIFDMLDRP